MENNDAVTTIDPSRLDDANYLLSFMMDRGIISEDDARRAEFMNKKKKVLSVHKHAVSQGKGKDKRWFTRVNDPKRNALRRIAGKTEEELIEKLFRFYFAEQARLSCVNLMGLYNEWRAYKLNVSNRTGTVRRLDNDYKRFYLKEPLSRQILTMPLAKMRKIDIEIWGYSLIKKHNFSKKQFYNMSTVLKQVLDFYGDLGYGQGNPFNQVHFRPNAFRRVVKKTAKTQIFYPDEVKKLFDLAQLKAEQTRDENYLAIPMIICLGLRVSECLGLAFSDFDQSNNLVEIHSSLSEIEVLKEDGTWETRGYAVEDYLKQNAAPRRILAGDDCFVIVNKIKAILQAKKIKREYLFKVQTPNNIEMKLYHLCEELGIEKRSPHKLRKTYISNLLNKGFDQDFVREQAGHQALQTTLNYYVYSTTRNEELIRRLNEAL